jgi:predicted porin
LEKIEMKKTLVAVAALAAATGAMAEVTISGFIDQAYNTTRTTTAAGASTTVKSLNNNAIGQDSLSFSVSEDLGNGITAFGAINFIPNVTTVASANIDNGSGIGLRGDFGTIVIGQGYSQVWHTTFASDAAGFGTGVGNAHGVGASAYGAGVGYVLPQLVSGLSVVLEHGPGELATSYGNFNGAGLKFESGGFMGYYSMGQYTAKGTEALTAVTQTSSVAGSSAVAAEWVTSPGVGSVAATTEQVTAGSKSSISALALTYDFGMAKVFAGYNTNKSGGDSDQTQTSNTIGLSVPLGAISVGIAQSSATYKSAAAAGVTINGTRLLAKYAFSKRTNGYIQYGTAKVTGGASATGNGIGLTHSF